MHIEIDTQSKLGKQHFTCMDVIHFENAHNFHASRYLLSFGGEQYLLDVQKTHTKSISLHFYQLIEMMDFDLNFLSLVGTSPLGYHNPNIKNIDYILYEKVHHPQEEKETIKFLVSEDELPDDPEEMGYYQDGNHNWYFMSDRSRGDLLKFEDEYKRSWEYRQEADERLLIQLSAFKSIREYIHEKPPIYIYEGKILKRKDIKITIKQKVLEPA